MSDNTARCWWCEGDAVAHQSVADRPACAHCWEMLHHHYEPAYRTLVHRDSGTRWCGNCQEPITLVETRKRLVWRHVVGERRIRWCHPAPFANSEANTLERL